MPTLIFQPVGKDARERGTSVAPAVVRARYAPKARPASLAALRVSLRENLTTLKALALPLCRHSFCPQVALHLERGAENRDAPAVRQHPGARTKGVILDREQCSASCAPGPRALAQSGGRDPADAFRGPLRPVVLGAEAKLPGIAGRRGALRVCRLAAP